MSKKVKNQLAVNRFYSNDNNNYDEDNDYISSQLKRWDSKSGRQRDDRVYLSASKLILDNLELTNRTIMWCLGTRNNWERDRFRLHLNSNVYSIDIAPNSGADLILDFNKVKFDSKIDVIYSNAIDHCKDPSSSYLNWLDNISDDGLMIIDFDSGVHRANSSDCSTF